MKFAKSLVASNVEYSYYDRLKGATVRKQVLEYKREVSHNLSKIPGNGKAYYITELIVTAKQDKSVEVFRKMFEELMRENKCESIVLLFLAERRKDLPLYVRALSTWVHTAGSVRNGSSVFPVVDALLRNESSSVFSHFTKSLTEADKNVLGRRVFGDNFSC